MSSTYACPSCAAPLIFRSKHSVYMSCPSCRSTVVRHGVNLELLGKVSELMDDLSLIQPQTKGRFCGKPFEVLGRLKVAWSDGFWNEWCVDMLGGTQGWLAEAQGSFVFYDRFAVPKLPVQTYKVGDVYQAPDNESYEVSDIKTARIIGIEGEVPHKFKLNEEFLSIDVQKPDERRGTLEIKDAASNFSYGAQQDAAKFQFENLRKLDGW